MWDPPVPASRSLCLTHSLTQHTHVNTHTHTHTHYSKAKRDSYMGLDVFYWTVLWPGEKLGIFWDVRDDEKGTYVRVRVCVRF